MSRSTDQEKPDFGARILDMFGEHMVRAARRVRLNIIELPRIVP